MERLPPEVWEDIAYVLLLSELVSLSLTYRALRSRFIARIQLRHGQLRDRFKLVEGLQGHGNSKEHSHSIGIALELILHRELHPNLIQYLLCHEISWKRHEIDYNWGASILNNLNGNALQH